MKGVSKTTVWGIVGAVGFLAYSLAGKFVDVNEEQLRSIVEIVGAIVTSLGWGVTAVLSQDAE